MPLIKDWFFLKPAFTSFKISPTKHPQYLFGEEDCALRDNLLTALRECTYSQQGYRAIIYGQAGRGKTHLANHLLYRACTSGLPLEVVYVDCPTVPSPKTPVSLFFSQVLRSISASTIKRVGPKFFENKTAEWEQKVQEELRNGAIYRALLQGLTTVNPEIIGKMLEWLGGELWDGITLLDSDAPRQITSETQIARNVGALGQIILLAEEKNLVFLLDEAERLQTIAGGEHYWKWLAGLRELFRRETVGFLLFIIARNRDDIPLVLQEEEIMSVIGTSNIFPCPPYAQPQAESFLRQLLESVIVRNPIPPALDKALLDVGERLDTYPFTQDAFERFVDYHSTGENVNIPREIINSLESSARRTISDGKNLIDAAVLQQVIQGNI